MIKKENFFKNNLSTSSKYKNNLKKTRKIFESFLVDLKNNQIPLLESYDKSYEFDFSTSMIKKYSKFKNIIIIGMGG